jgi:hypothetical protein
VRYRRTETAAQNVAESLAGPSDEQVAAVLPIMRGVQLLNRAAEDGDINVPIW